MNKNLVRTGNFSNSASETLYKEQWQEERQCREQYLTGLQCGGCSFFAPFNADWGLCCNEKSRHYLETIFEHFTCPSFVNEGWGPHSFTADREYQCGRCQGGPCGRGEDSDEERPSRKPNH
jgi:hypothetical protein